MRSLRVVSCLVLSACGAPGGPARSDGAQPPDLGQEPPEDLAGRRRDLADPPSDATPGTFGEIYEKVLVSEGCTSGYCHGNGAGDLVLTTRDKSYANLVRAAPFNGSCQVPFRVAPGDPQKSLMWKKVAPGVTVCGDKMPQGSEGLSQEQADRIARWIKAGAPR